MFRPRTERLEALSIPGMCVILFLIIPIAIILMFTGLPEERDRDHERSSRLRHE